ncbi:MAG: L,D-transpeptidase family protein [Candidatus Edwardsbacteria bacterium]|nr:L,D-transpeptidase family protein [Candidatus Edwardsbacteria bacterium]
MTRRARMVLAISLWLWLCGEAEAQPAFKQRQLEHSRVRAAFIEKEPRLKTSYSEQGLAYPPGNIFIRIFKREKQLEVWAGSGPGGYRLAGTYAICSSSGELGPKRARGDRQVPEGFYHISHFNPASSFHLSLGLSYPNRSDRILKRGRDPGGSIYIHGDCVTIGCVPITDDGIKELYLLAVEARAAGQARIPVHVFPARLDSLNFAALQREYAGDGALLGFWENLKTGYDRFQSSGRVPKVTIDNNGKYLFE